MSDRVSELKQLKDLLWDSIFEVDSDKRSPLAAQLRAVMADIAEAEGAGEPPAPAEGSPVDPVDELLAFRMKKAAGK